MKPKIIPVLEDCIENGLRLGFNRARKYDSNPNEEDIFSNQINAIMNEIFERFDFEELKDV
jgi:hypothetical protein